MHPKYFIILLAICCSLAIGYCKENNTVVQIARKDMTMSVEVDDVLGPHVLFWRPTDFVYRLVPYRLFEAHMDFNSTIDHSSLISPEARSALKFSKFEWNISEVSWDPTGEIASFDAYATQHPGDQKRFSVIQFNLMHHSTSVTQVDITFKIHDYRWITTQSRRVLVLEVLFDGDVEPDDDLIGGGASAFKLRDAYFGAADTAISRDHKNNPESLNVHVRKEYSKELNREVIWIIYAPFHKVLDHDMYFGLNKPSYTAGAIIGMVIAAAIVAGGIGGVVYYFVRRRRRGIVREIT